MSTILRLKLATSIIDATLRATQLEEPELVSADDVLLLGWLKEEPGMRGAEVAWRCGRSRANMHRTLKRLEAHKVVEPLPSSFNGKTSGWVMTEAGEAIYRRVSLRLEAWDKKLQGAGEDVAQLSESLLKVMQTLLRPFDRGALSTRLVRPERPDKVSEWDW